MLIAGDVSPAQTVATRANRTLSIFIILCYFCIGLTSGAAMAILAVFFELVLKRNDGIGWGRIHRLEPTVISTVVY